MPMPSVGQFLVLHVPEGTFKGHYHAQVQDMDKRWFLIDIPISVENNILEPLPEGTRIVVHFTDTKDTPCEFDSVVEAHLFRKVHLQALKRPEKQAIRRNQRREFVRVPASIPVEIVVMDLETKRIHTLQCMTLNVSGGGVSVILRPDQPIRSGDLVGVWFQLNVSGQFYDIFGKARILKVSPCSEFSSRKIGAVKFVEINEQDRQTIIQYVFRRQIELRERGWLRSRK